LGAGFEIGVGGDGFCERENAIDNGLEAARGDKLQDREELGFGAHVGAEERKLAAEEEAQVDFGVEAGRCAAGDEAAAGSETRDAVVPRRGANVLKDDADAAFVRDAADFVANFLRFVIDEVVGAQLFGFLELFIGAGGGDDARAKKFRDLNGGGPHPTARSEDENVLARLQFGAADEHVPGCLKNEGDGGGFFKGKIFGIREAIHFWNADEFGAAAVNHVTEIGELAAAVVEAGDAGGTFAAADTGSEEDFLANADGGDFGADLRDFAGDVAARNVREGERNAWQTLADPEVEMIERAGFDAHKNFVGLDCRLRNIDEFENVRRTVLLENDGFHPAPFLRARNRNRTK
jgi:hypothetical protein